jgi:hypothetical protein
MRYIQELWVQEDGEAAAESGTNSGEDFGTHVGSLSRPALEGPKTTNQPLLFAGKALLIVPPNFCAAIYDSHVVAFMIWHPGSDRAEFGKRPATNELSFF